MRFDYWPISVIPRPMGITRIGVGIVVIDPATRQAKSKFRTDESMYHNPEILDETVTALENFKADLEKITATADPNRKGQHALSHHLEFASQHWQNLVHVHPKQSMDADNIDTATNLLFATLIGENSTKGTR